MKQLLLSLLLIAGVISASGRGTTVTTGSGVYDVDTVFHAKVGPGTTQTSLRLTGPYSLNVFYLTIDRTVPGVSLRCLSGGDKLAGNARTSVMAQNHTHDGLHYFAGSNGDFYVTSGNASNGSSIVGTPVNAFAVDGEIFRTSYGSYQFSVDMEGIARICRLSFLTGTATCGETTVSFQSINEGARDNSVSLFTSKYYGSTNHPQLADNCSEVTARLVEGDQFTAGGTYRMEVTSTATHTGDLDIPADGFVILGRGTANDFVNNLQVGDIVTFDNITLTPEGERIYPSCIMSGNPKNVGGGINLNSESERGDASDRHPRTGIGFSEDGSKVVIMVIDGRTVASVGVTTGTLGDVMMFAGCHEAVNLDGGGSSTLYTEALGVRNHCSDGRERAVSNAIYAVLEAPEDSEVAEIQFYDYNPIMPYLGLYTPRIMAFNKYGLCIDTDYKDYTLTCEPEFGEIVDDGHTIFITGSGMHALTAHVGDLTCSVPIEIANASEATLSIPSVIIDNTHPYTIGLYSMVKGAQVGLNPAALSWTSNDESIATVDASGVITAVANGTTTVVGRLDDIVVEQTVVVENHDNYILPLYAEDAVSSWRSSKTDIANLVVTPEGEGFNVQFTISKTRNPKLQLTMVNESFTYGIPEAFDFVINSGNTVLTRLLLNVITANNAAVQTMELADIPAGESTVRFLLSDFIDSEDITSFPIQIKSMVFNFGNEVNAACSFDVKAIYQNYDITQGVRGISVEPTRLCVAVNGGVAHLAAPAERIVLTDLAGRVIATSTGSEIALPAGHGIVLLTADGATIKVAY